VTNGIALAIGGAIAALVALDLLVFGWDLHLFLGRKFVDLVEYVSFWR